MGKYLDGDWRTAYDESVPLDERKPPRPELRTLHSHYTCKGCGKTINGAAWTLFEWFTNAVTLMPDVRVSAFRCMGCGPDESEGK